MPRGGARPGAGRKKGQRKPPAAPVQVDVVIPVDAPSERRFPTSLEFLRAVWNGEVLASEAHIKAATAALPFEHPKLMNVKPGKKETAADAAKAAGSGRFAPPAAPKMVVDNTK